MNMNIVILGILVSIIFYELTDITPGGIVIPGILVMYIKQPERMIYTIIIAIITYFIVKLISRYFLIFGKRRFVVMILVSLLLSVIMQQMVRITSFSLIDISIIGYTAAGIIANNIHRQGIKRTVPSLAICVAIIELIVLISNSIGA